MSGGRIFRIGCLPGMADQSMAPISTHRRQWCSPMDRKGVGSGPLLRRADVEAEGVRLKGDVILACVVGELQGSIGTEAAG